VNRAICITTWREFRSNSLRLVLLSLFLMVPLLGFTVGRCFDPAARSADLLSPSWFALAYTVLWGAGVIGREVQHGTISLVLARPISIISYVTSKWLAVAIAASSCSILAVLIEHLISCFSAPTLFFRAEFLLNGLERIFICFGAAAFLICLSSLVNGIADLALLAGMPLAILLSNLLLSIGWRLSGHTEMMRNNLMWHFFLFLYYPHVEITKIVAGNYHDLTGLIAYAAYITGFLSLAIFTLTRREFSYAAE